MPDQSSLPPEPRNPEYSEDFLYPGMSDTLIQRMRDIEGYSDAALYMRSQVISLDEAVDVLESLLRGRTRVGGNVETRERVIDIGHLVNEVKRGNLPGRPVSRGHYVTTVRALMRWIESGGSARYPLTRNAAKSGKYKTAPKIDPGADITTVKPPEWM